MVLLVLVITLRIQPACHQEPTKPKDAKYTYCERIMF
jgi:hypothetical protein